MSRGWVIWALAFVLGLSLPGAPRPQPPSPFPIWTTLGVLTLLLAMALLTLALAARFGPGPGMSRPLALWEAIPDLLWGAFALALWPRAWGPPGFPALALTCILAALPGELRWLAQALPQESQGLRAWGPEAITLSRRLALRRLLPRWLGARLPLWLTATLVLERILGIRGPGSDWMMRVALRERLGIALWLLAFMGLWILQGEER